VRAVLAFLEPLADLDVPAVALRHPRRDPGRPPTVEEDPYNALIRICEVAGADRGPLVGMRIGVKDNIAVAGVPMTDGRRSGPPIVPREDAIVVERLLDAGATIVAKTNISTADTEFGPTRNPRNTRFHAGASSSGSGAAVAGGLVDGALGADQGGSIRNPAACCGIVGMKATHGLVPTYGLSYWDHTLDHIGPMTRTVAENAAMLEVMAGDDWRDAQSAHARPTTGNYSDAAERGVEGLRIGVVTESRRGCTEGTLAAFDRACEQLRALGAEVVPVSVPLWEQASIIWFAVAMCGVTAMAESLGEGYGHLARIDADRVGKAAAQRRDHGLELLSLAFPTRSLPLVVEHLRAAHDGLPIARAHNLRLELRRQVDAILEEVDVLVTPTAPTGPVAIDGPRADDDDFHGSLAAFARSMATACPLNLTGHPALTVPSGPGDDDLPTGLQICGPRFGERTLYRVGFAFEAAQDSLVGGA
jgi:amidase